MVESSGVVNGLTSEQALERIRSGDVVSRPAWEDVFTSMATDRPNSSGYKESLSYVRLVSVNHSFFCFTLYMQHR